MKGVPYLGSATANSSSKLDTDGNVSVRDGPSKMAAATDSSVVGTNHVCVPFCFAVT